MRIGTALIRGIAREILPAAERVVAHRPPPPLLRGSSVRGGFGPTGVFRKPRPSEGPVRIDDEIRRFISLRERILATLARLNLSSEVMYSRSPSRRLIADVAELRGVSFGEARNQVGELRRNWMELRQHLQFALTGGHRVGSPAARRWTEAWLEDLTLGTTLIDRWLQKIPTHHPSYAGGLRNVQRWLSYQQAVAFHLEDDVMAAEVIPSPQAVGELVRTVCDNLSRRVDTLLSSFNRSNYFQSR